VKLVHASRGYAASSLLAALVLLGGGGCGEGSAPKVRTATIHSKTYEIDGIYRSMKGPLGRQAVSFAPESAEPDLLWITGYRTEIVDPEEDRVVSPEFMCHSNLDLRRGQPARRLLDDHGTKSNRLFTVSQGQMEVQFPEGFGVPILSTEKLTLDTQVLNLNPQPETFEVQHRTTIEYVRDDELDEPMRPLFQRAAQGMVALDGEPGYFGLDDPDPEEHGPGCMVGTSAGGRILTDRFGRRFAAHWVVPPGRQVNRTLVTQWMDIPFDTAVHYIAGHVHPFAESVKLVDRTADEVVYESRVTNADARIGIERVESFSSAEGIPVYADHEYEIVSVYDNTSGEPQDAMAVLFLYMHDKAFEKPSPERLRALANAAPPSGS